MNKEVQLRLGEDVMQDAPTIQLNNGQHCIPQHYLTYQHTLASVEALICDIEYDPRYIVFAAQEESGIYIQVGVIGHDNYQCHSKTNTLKLLFGRKWRVEAELPTSEIIQTVFLAIKKSREHEIRELYKLILNDSTTTPFNTHIDLPLLAQQYKQQTPQKIDTAKIRPAQQVSKILSHINYDCSTFKLHHIEQRQNGLWLIDIAVNKTLRSTLPETEDRIIYLQIDELSLNTVSREIMKALISLSDSHVDKNFSYQGFHRFDPEINIAGIADLSHQSRKHQLTEDFSSQFSKTNKEVDQKRIPPVKAGKLAQKHQDVIKQFLKVEQ